MLLKFIIIIKLFIYNFQQVGPADAWKFRQIMLIVLSVGTLASVLFHFAVTEKQSRILISNDENESSTLHSDILRKFLLYQVSI